MLIRDIKIPVDDTTGIFRKNYNFNQNIFIYSYNEISIYIHPINSTPVIHFNNIDILIKISDIIKIPDISDIDIIMSHLVNNEINISKTLFLNYKKYDTNLKIIHPDKFHKIMSIFTLYSIYINNEKVNLTINIEPNFEYLVGKIRNTDYIVFLIFKNNELFLEIKDDKHMDVYSRKIKGYSSLDDYINNSKEGDRKFFIRKLKNLNSNQGLSNNKGDIIISKVIIENKDILVHNTLKIESKKKRNNKKIKYNYYDYFGIPIYARNDLEFDNIINNINDILDKEFTFKDVSDINKEKYFNKCILHISKLIKLNSKAYSIKDKNQFNENIENIIDKYFIDKVDNLL